MSAAAATDKRYGSGQDPIQIARSKDRLHDPLGSPQPPLVERLEAVCASFVSVTHRGTSMGRRTLNVHRRFAQFEREVTVDPGQDRRFKAERAL